MLNFVTVYNIQPLIGELLTHFFCYSLPSLITYLAGLLFDLSFSIKVSSCPSKTQIIFGVISIVFL